MAGADADNRRSHSLTRVPKLTQVAPLVSSVATAVVGSDYRMRLRPRPGTDAIRNLRRALKMLLRRYGLQAVEIEEIKPPERANYTSTPK